MIRSFARCSTPLVLMQFQRRSVARQRDRFQLSQPLERFGHFYRLIADARGVQARSGLIGILLEIDEKFLSLPITDHSPTDHRLLLFPTRPSLLVCQLAQP